MCISSYWSHCCPLNIAADMIGVTGEEYMIKKLVSALNQPKSFQVETFSSVLVNLFLIQQ